MRDYDIPWSSAGKAPPPRVWDVTMRVGGFFQATGEPKVELDDAGFWLRIGDSRFAVGDIVVYQPRAEAIP